jgi:hypothetical protein
MGLTCTLLTTVHTVTYSYIFFHFQFGFQVYKVAILLSLRLSPAKNVAFLSSSRLVSMVSNFLKRLSLKQIRVSFFSLSIDSELIQLCSGFPDDFINGGSISAKKVKQKLYFLNRT